MRALLFVVALLGALALAPRVADAAEAPADAASREAGTSAPAAGADARDPMAPEDWIPVFAIGCYIVLPAILVLAGVVLYASWVQRNTAEPVALRAPLLRAPPPRGIVLLRF